MVITPVVEKVGIRTLRLFRELKLEVGLAKYLKGPHKHPKKFTTPLRLGAWLTCRIRTES